MTSHAQFREFLINKFQHYVNGKPQTEFIKNEFQAKADVYENTIHEFNKLPDVAEIINKWIDKESTRNCAISLSWLKEQINNIVGGNEPRISFNYIDVAAELLPITEDVINRIEEKQDDARTDYERGYHDFALLIKKKLKELSK